MFMPKSLLTAAFTFAVVLTGSGTIAVAEEGDFVVRLLGMDSMADPQADQSGQSLLAGRAWNRNRVVPELGVSYFITNNIAADFTLDGNRYAAETPNWPASSLGNGEIQGLPPVVTLQYHFLPDNGFKAYIGAGLDYSRGQERDAPGGNGDIDYGDTLNYAFEAGFDYYFRQDWAVNFDLKTVFVDTDVSAGGAAIDGADEDLNPWVVGVGFTYNF